MARSLDAGTITTLQSDQNLQMFHLVTMYLTTTQRMTEYAHDISYDFGSGTETFTSSGRLTALSEVQEDQSINNVSIQLGITGANTADISLLLTEDYTNKRVIIRRGFFDATGATTDANIVGRPFIIFDGKVSSWGFTDDPQGGNSQISWELASHWVDWEKTNGRKTNPQNNKLHFSTDNSYDFVYDRIGDRIWGKVSG